MRKLWIIAATVLFTFLFVAGSSLAQHETHQQGQVKKTADSTPPQTTMAVIPVNLPETLKSLDNAVREIEKAVERNDGRVLASSMKSYLSALETVESYFDSLTPDSKNFEKEVSRTEKTLDRQIVLLNRLSSQGPVEFRDDLKGALDASQRTRDGLGTASSGAPRDGHHRNGGHHGRGSWFGRMCRG